MSDNSGSCPMGMMVGVGVAGFLLYHLLTKRQEEKKDDSLVPI